MIPSGTVIENISAQDPIWDDYNHDYSSLEAFFKVSCQSRASLVKVLLRAVDGKSG